MEGGLGQVKHLPKVPFQVKFLDFRLHLALYSISLIILRLDIKIVIFVTN